MIKKLQTIQTKLKANKGQYNSFGKYSYRSCEDILEAVKPLLAEQGLILTLSDKIVLIGDRYYIEAKALLTDGDTEVITTAYAREEENKKGMDSSQVTGATSSYARKYALNGLFCIDDNKDADTDEYVAKTKKAEKTELSYREKVIITAKEKGIDVKELAKDYNLTAKTTEARYKEVLADLEGK